jgi:hypothetical protein
MIWSGGIPKNAAASIALRDIKIERLDQRCKRHDTALTLVVRPEEKY